ncbi:hypothetical protein EGM92_16350, partial [Enterobacter cloacae]
MPSIRGSVLRWARPTIIINELDAERIDRLLEKPEFASLPVADALNEELD